MTEIAISSQYAFAAARILPRGRLDHAAHAIRATAATWIDGIDARWFGSNAYPFGVAPVPDITTRLRLARTLQAILTTDSAPSGSDSSQGGVVGTKVNPMRPMARQLIVVRTYRRNSTRCRTKRIIAVSIGVTKNERCTAVSTASCGCT